MHIFVFFLLFVNVASGQDADDPCNIYSILPNAEQRLVNNKFDSATNTALSDRTLVEGWYFTHGKDIVTQPPDLLSCGTRFPIWMKGSMPSVRDNEVNRTACVRHIRSDCIDELEIKVKNCKAFYVYYLTRTNGADEAFCFGVGKPGIKPTYVPPSVEVTVELIDHPVEDVYISEAQCLFEEGKTPYYYHISWFIDGVFVKTSPALRYKNIAAGYLSINKATIQTLGRKIKCSVFVRLLEEGPVGPRTESSEKFVGIEILTPIVAIKRGETGHISVRPTLGFSCFPRADTCELALELSAPPGCTGVNVIGSGNCATKLVSTEWNNIYNITVQATEGDKHDFTATFHVALQTSRYHTHEIWDMYRTKEITIHVLESENKKGLENTYCEARDDPHMITFDQRPYDIQYQGDFVLYKHDEFPMLVEVKVRSCRGGGYPYCVCAVAVQAGRDVFVVDRCADSKMKKAEFTSCGDNVLDVRGKTEKRFVIYFPTGTRVQVDVSTRTLMIQIYPSIRDWKKTRGLCGVLSKNCPDDFLMSNGILFDDGSKTKKKCEGLGGYDAQFKPKTFSDSWTLSNSKHDNMFDIDGVDERLSPWDVKYLLCQCTKDDDDQKHKVSCKPSMVTECQRKDRPIVSLGHCKIKSSIRRKRSHKAFDNGKESRRVKRSTQLTTAKDHVQMTIEEAREYCSKTLFNVPSFKLCSEVPNVDSNASVELCAVDIILSNSTEWVDASVESLKMRCLEELNLNTTLQEEDENGISIAKTIQSVACPEECSGVGICSNGTCICPTGFGASDCSINLSIPPYFDSILDDGMCDIQEWKCDQAVITGDDFVNIGNPACRIRPFHITQDNETIEGTEEMVNANVQTLMSLYCPLPKSPARNRRATHQDAVNVFVKGYTISLSNDGRNFGDGQRIYIFDSLCQNPVEVNGKPGFTLRDGFCFIDNACVAEGQVNSENICQLCYPNINIYTWSQRNEGAVCLKSPSKSTEKYWIIGAVLGAVAVAAVVVTVVVWRLKCNRTKKIHDTNFQSPSAGLANSKYT